MGIIQVVNILKDYVQCINVLKGPFSVKDLLIILEHLQLYTQKENYCGQMPEFKLKVNRKKLVKESLQTSIDGLLDTIIQEVEEQMKTSSCFIMNLSTGVGKSTRFIYKLFKYFSSAKVICSQVTVINTISLCKYVASSSPDLSLGVNIGYQSGGGRINTSTFNSITYQTLKLTTLQYLIELQKGSLRNPQNYIIVIDEAHTNDMNSQEQQAIIRDLLRTKTREQLPFFIIQSASIDVEQYMKYFGLDSYIQAEGTRFPVKQLFLEDFDLESETDIVKGATKVVETIVNASYLKVPCGSQCAITEALEELDIKNPSSILIFISKQKQMDNLVDKLKKSQIVKQAKLEFVLISAQSIEKDSTLISRADNPTPKIYISTNVIETGYTINNISFIIDCMKFKQIYRNPISKVDISREVPIDKQMQQQRRGRVGRTQPGIYIGIATKRISEQLVQKRELDIQITNLQSVIAQFGIEQFLALEFLEKVPSEHFIDYLQVSALIGEDRIKNKNYGIIQSLLFSGIYFNDFRQVILILLTIIYEIRLIDVICILSFALNPGKFKPNRSTQANDFTQMLQLLYEGRASSPEISNQTNRLISIFKQHNFNIYQGDPISDQQTVQRFASCISIAYYTFMFQRKSEDKFVSKQGLKININLPSNVKYFVCMNVELSQEYTCKNLIEITKKDWDMLPCK